MASGVREIRQVGRPYCYTYSPFHPPIAQVKPGETVVTEGRNVERQSQGEFSTLTQDRY